MFGGIPGKDEALGVALVFIAVGSTVRPRVKGYAEAVREREGRDGVFEKRGVEADVDTLRPLITVGAANILLDRFKSHAGAMILGSRWGKSCRITDMVQ